MTCSRILPIVAALFSALVAAPAAFAQTAHPQAPFSHRWGVNDDHLATGPAPDAEGRLPEGDLLLRARQAGLGWARYVLFWYVANPAEGQYEWGPSDIEIARLHAAGFNVLVHVAYPPAWTTGAPFPNDFSAFYCLDESRTDGVKQDPYCLDPESRPGRRRPPQPPLADRSRDFRAFVELAVRRYQGKVRAWSFGMEVHNKVYWRGEIRQLVDEVLRPGYEIVKGVDPGLLVAGPDDDVESSAEFVLRLEAEDIGAGKSPVFDVLAFHAFSHVGWAQPCQLEVEWRQPPQAMDESCSAAGATTGSFRGIAQRYGRGRPVWLTEIGYRRITPQDPTEPTRMADWLGRWIAGIKARPWIDKSFFYRLKEDDGIGGFGLFTEAPPPPGAETPAVVALSGALAGQALPRSSYLAEGATAGFFDLDVLVANPGTQPAPVKLTFLNDNGTVETLADTLPPTSRRTYGIGRTHLPSLSTAGGVSTVVESTLGAPIVVERSMFWDRAGYYGGHGGAAVTRPETRWYFGEGAQGFFDTYVLLANSNTVAASATVTFLLDDPGAAPVVVAQQVAASQRATVWAGAVPALVGKSFSIVVDADVPIIAERAMYFGLQPFWTGGHESAGVPALSPTWLLAEGATGPYFDNYVLVGNPGTVPVDVRFTFLLPGGRVVVGTPRRAAGATGLGTLAPQSRFTLDVENAGAVLDILEGDAAWLADTAVSTKVDASEPIVVERAMYWPGGFQTWTEAHNSFGVTEPGTRWGLAEGRNEGPRAFETYILVANPSPQDATVRVRFLRPDGTTSEVTKVVQANARENVFPSEMPVGEFGAIVESTNGVPIVVERAMYWNGPGGQSWAGGTNATAVKLP